MIALAGVLAGYSGRTREAYAVDLRQFFAWCSDRELRLFDAHRADIELYARDLEEHGEAKATIALRLSTIAGSTATPSRRASPSTPPPHPSSRNGASADPGAVQTGGG